MAEFAFPSLSYLRKVCLETAQAMHINSMRDQQAAAVKIRFCQPPARPEDAATRRPALVSALKKFNTLNQVNFIIRPAEEEAELITNRLAVARMTDDFTFCRLHAFLEERLDDEVVIGYGLGDDMHQARINALDASREAARLPAPGSCLINEKDELIGPLKIGAKLIVSREVSDGVRSAAHLSGLSYLTIQKIQAAAADFGERRLTARDLAYKLSITTRSANRFLSSLAEAGLASVVEVRRATTKGRPERIYHVALD